MREAEEKAKERCLKQGRAKRIAFNQIKNGTFKGTRADGEWIGQGVGTYGRGISRAPRGGSSTPRSQRARAIALCALPQLPSLIPPRPRR